MARSKYMEIQSPYAGGYTFDFSPLDVEVTTMADGHRWWVKFNQPTPKGESLLVELTFCYADPDDKKSLPYVAKRQGWSDKMLSTWWGIQTYTTDSDGNQWGERYNPTHKMEPYTVYEGKESVVYYRNVKDFDWWLEATPENARKLLSEVERRAYGKSGDE